MNFFNTPNMTAPWKRIVVIAAIVAITTATAPVRAIADDEVVLTPSDDPAPIAVEAKAPAEAPTVKAEKAIPFTAPATIANADDALRIAQTGYKVVRVYNKISSTAYTSRPQETDDTPFIAADGTHVYDGMVAANFLPFGTKIRIPALYGDKVFEVHDRMNKRYHYKVDIWMEKLQDARNHGLRTLDIEIVEPVDVTAAA